MQCPWHVRLWGVRDLASLPKVPSCESCLQLQTSPGVSYTLRFVPWPDVCTDMCPFSPDLKFALSLNTTTISCDCLLNIGTQCSVGISGLVADIRWLMAGIMSTYWSRCSTPDPAFHVHVYPSYARPVYAVFKSIWMRCALQANHQTAMLTFPSPSITWVDLACLPSLSILLHASHLSGMPSKYYCSS